MPDPSKPYQFGVDDQGDAPLGGENAPPADPNDPAPEDPVLTTTSFRKAVLTLLTEIRDALVSGGDGEAP